MRNIWVDFDLTTVKGDADPNALLDLLRHEINVKRANWESAESVAMSDAQWEALSKPHRIFDLVVSCPALDKTRPIQINRG